MSTETENVTAAGCPDGCFYGIKMRGGAPIYVKVCMVCDGIDFDDLAAQADAIAEKAAGLVPAEVVELAAKLGMSDDGFQLSGDGGKTWRAATKAQYVAAERAAGFRNTLGEPDEPATSSWSSGDRAGRMRFLEPTP